MLHPGFFPGENPRKDEALIVGGGEDEVLYCRGGLQPTLRGLEIDDAHIEGQQLDRYCCHDLLNSGMLEEGGRFFAELGNLLSKDGRKRNRKQLAAN